MDSGDDRLRNAYSPIDVESRVPQYKPWVPSWQVAEQKKEELKEAELAEKKAKQVNVQKSASSGYSVTTVKNEPLLIPGHWTTQGGMRRHGIRDEVKKAIAERQVKIDHFVKNGYEKVAAKSVNRLRKEIEALTKYL